MERRIRQWFELADDSGDGQLTKTELEVALKASGIPADTEAILEIINLFDYDGDGEIAWREFHNYFAHEVMAGKDPLGSEYVLPSGTALPLGSMIGAIRRRKIISDVVEKGGKARGFWCSEGPEFLRYLLESEHYTLEGQGSSRTRDTIMRILAYKPPPSKEADPAAVEEHRRRIDRLKMILMRTASGKPFPEAGGEGGSAAAKAASAKRLATQRRLAVDVSGGGGVGARASGGGRGGAGAGAADAPAPAAATTEGVGVGSGPSGRPVRFAAALAATAAALESLAAEEAAEQQEQHQKAEAASSRRAGGHRAEAAGPRASHRDEATTSWAADASVVPAAPAAAAGTREAGNNNGSRGSSAGSSSNGDAVPASTLDDASSAPIEAALSCADQMRRLDEALEHHRQRTGTPRPRPAAGSIALASSRAGNPRPPVVLPVQVATAGALGSPAATPRRLTGDGGSWEGPDGTQRTAPAVGAGPGGRCPVPPPPQQQQPHPQQSFRQTASSGCGGAGAGGEGAGAGANGGTTRRPRPTPLRGCGPGSGEDQIDEDSSQAVGGFGCGGSSRPSSSRSLLLSPQESRIRLGASRQPSGLSASERESPAYGPSAEGAAPAAAAPPPEAERGGSSVHGSLHGTTGTADGAAGGAPSVAGAAASADTSQAGGSITASSPQATVPRVGPQLVQRSLSTGRGPYSAQLIRSGRASGRTHGSGSPSRPSASGASLSGFVTSLDTDRSSRLALLGVGASPQQTATGEMSQPGTVRPSLDGSGAGTGPGAGVWLASASTAVTGPDASGLNFGGGGAAAGQAYGRASGAATAFGAPISALRPKTPSQASVPTSPHGASSRMLPSGRAEAAAAAADIRRMAWGAHGQASLLPQSQQCAQIHGGWPLASAPTSPAGAATATSPAAGARNAVGASGSSAHGGAAAGGPRTVCSSARARTSAVAGQGSLSGGAAFAGATLRRSVDLGEFSTERVGAQARSGGAGASAGGFAAMTSAAAASWLGAAAAKAAADAAESTAAYALKASLRASSGGGPDGFRAPQYGKPQIQIPAQIQVPPASGLSPTQGPQTPQGLPEGCANYPCLPTPTTDRHSPMSAVAPGTGLQQPTRGSGAPLQPTLNSRSAQATPSPSPRSAAQMGAVAAANAFAAAAGGGVPWTAAAAAATASGSSSGRRSFDLESQSHSATWHATVRSPGSAVAAATPASGGSAHAVGHGKEAGGGGLGWMRGRLMKTCLASTLRQAQPPQSTATAATAAAAPPPPSPTTAPHGGCASSGANAAAAGVVPGSPIGSSGSGSAAGDGGHYRNGPGGAHPGGEDIATGARAGDGARRKVLGGLLFNDAVTAVPGAAQLPGAVQGAGKGSHGPPPDLRLPTASAVAPAASADYPTLKDHELADAAEAEAAETPQPMHVVGVGRESPVPGAVGSKWPWPWKKDMPATGHHAPAQARQAVDAVAAAAAATQSGGGSSRPLQVRASALRLS